MTQVMLAATFPKVVVNTTTGVVEVYSGLRDAHARAGLAAEEAARIAGDAALQAAIEAEESARIAADADLQSAIEAEEAARIAADASLADAIAALDESLAPVAKSGGAADVAFTPAGGISASDVQGAIEEAADRANHTGTQTLATIADALDQLTYSLASKAALEAATVPGDVDLVRLHGYTSAGDGGGAPYVRVGSEPAHPGKIQSGDGAWWGIAPGCHVTPRTFGAVEKTNGQEDALEDFFAWAATNTDGRNTMSHSGEYWIGRGVEVPLCAEVAFAPGSLILRPNSDNTSVIEFAIKLGNCEQSRFGRIWARGYSGDNTFAYGIIGRRIRGSQFSKFRASDIRLFGAAVTSRDLGDGYSANNNTSLVSEHRYVSCGIRGQEVAFEELSRTASASPTTDHSILACDLDFLYDMLVIQRGVPIKIGDHYFVVTSYDKPAKEARIFPSLEVIGGPLIEEGTLKVFAGGGLLTDSNDSGQMLGTNVNVRLCSVGLFTGSAYGGTFIGFVSHFNDIAIADGRPPASFSEGNVFINPYFEDPLGDELQYLCLSANAASTFQDVSTEIANVYSLFVSTDPRRRDRFVANINFVGKTSAFTAADTLGGPPRVTSYRRASPYDPNAAPPPDFMAHAGGFPIFAFDLATRTYTFNLGVVNMNTLSKGASGFAGVFVNVALTNKIVLNAPTGETIHGEASITLTDLPPHFFLVAGRAGATTWQTAIEVLESAASYIEE